MAGLYQFLPTFVLQAVPEHLTENAGVSAFLLVTNGQDPIASFALINCQSDNNSEFYSYVLKMALPNQVT
jgi:hypothetical protein